MPQPAAGGRDIVGRLTSDTQQWCTSPPNIGTDAGGSPRLPVATLDNQVLELAVAALERRPVIHVGGAPDPLGAPHIPVGIPDSTVGPPAADCVPGRGSCRPFVSVGVV